MTNTEISDNNPEKELKIDKSISDDKTKQISKKNTTQNKKITPKNDKSTKSFDEMSNELFSDLFSKKDSLVKEIKELEAIVAAVVGGCLLTGGYGSAIGAAFGALIFGTVSMGIYYTDVDTDWFKVFLGVMMLIAVIFNNYIRRRVTENK